MRFLLHFFFCFLFLIDTDNWQVVQSTLTVHTHKTGSYDVIGMKCSSSRIEHLWRVTSGYLCYDWSMFVWAVDLFMVLCR